MKIDLENVMRKSTSLIFKIRFLRYKNVQPPPFLGKCDSCDNPIVTHRHFVSKSFDSVYFMFQHFVEQKTRLSFSCSYFYRSLFWPTL